MKLVVVTLMKYLSFIFRSGEVNHQEMPSKEVMVGWNAETAEAKRQEDLQHILYTKHTKTASKVQ